MRDRDQLKNGEHIIVRPVLRQWTNARFTYEWTPFRDRPNHKISNVRVLRETPKSLQLGMGKHGEKGVWVPKFCIAWRSSDRPHPGDHGSFEVSGWWAEKVGWGRGRGSRQRKEG